MLRFNKAIVTGGDKLGFLNHFAALISVARTQGVKVDFTNNAYHVLFKELLHLKNFYNFCFNE